MINRVLRAEVLEYPLIFLFRAVSIDHLLLFGLCWECYLVHWLQNKWLCFLCARLFLSDGANDSNSTVSLKETVPTFPKKWAHNAGNCRSDRGLLPNRDKEPSGGHWTLCHSDISGWFCKLSAMLCNAESWDFYSKYWNTQVPKFEWFSYKTESQFRGLLRRCRTSFILFEICLNNHWLSHRGMPTLAEGSKTIKYCFEKGLGKLIAGF